MWKSNLSVEVSLPKPGAIQDLHANHSNNNVMPQAVWINCEPLVTKERLSSWEHDMKIHFNIREIPGNSQKYSACIGLWRVKTPGFAQAIPY